MYTLKRPIKMVPIISSKEMKVGDIAVIREGQYKGRIIFKTVWGLFDLEQPTTIWPYGESNEYAPDFLISPLLPETELSITIK